MKKPQNKKGILLTEILVAMVLITLIVVGGFQAVKSWKDSTHQYNTVQALITHIPSALDQVMVRKSLDAHEVTVDMLTGVTAQADETSWGDAIANCSATTPDEFCIDVTLPSNPIAVDMWNALDSSTGANLAIQDKGASEPADVTLEIKYQR